ncbi:MAG: methionine synthase [Polyangia bacterium]|nr:methionine synthase [Polyangia bacterium]
MIFDSVATCIGSFPHLDPRAACDFLLAALPDCPAWPQLPMRSYRESMYAQYAASLPGARIDEAAGRTTLDLSAGADDQLASFFEAALSDAPSGFEPRREDAAGYHAFLERLNAPGAPTGPLVKGHVTGPISFGLTVTRPDGRAVFYDDTLRDVVIHGLAAQARAQTRALAATGRAAVLFVDEPYLSSYGSATVPLSAQEVVESLTTVTDAVKAAGGIPGVHCCGNTDWSLLFSSSAEIVNFDAYSYLDTMALYPEALGAFLERGGTLAWGVVPTDSALLESETAESLLARLQGGMERLAASGVPLGALRRSFLVTPSCGTGTLSEHLAERAVRLAAEVAARMRGASPTGSAQAS